MTITSDILAATLNPAPKARWRNYAIAVRGKVTTWVTPERATEIEATCETRMVRDRAGMIHQYLEQQK